MFLYCRYRFGILSINRHFQYKVKSPVAEPASIKPLNYCPKIWIECPTFQKALKLHKYRCRRLRDKSKTKPEKRKFIITKFPTVCRLCREHTGNEVTTAEKPVKSKDVSGIGLLFAHYLWRIIFYTKESA